MKRTVAIAGVLLVGAYWSALAIQRHAAFSSNAFDLGYITQTLWYTAHGQPFRFTTLEGIPFSPEAGLEPTQFHRPYSLLAFHVEPLLLAVAPIFAIWTDPRLLLAVQGFALALGALAAAGLARQRLGGDLAAAVFGAAYLLSPSIAAAALSDFHAVALGSSFLMLALYALVAGHRRLAVIAAVLAAAAREDAAIIVATLGAYLWLRSAIAKRTSGRPATAIQESPTKAIATPPDSLDSHARVGIGLLLGAGGWAAVAFGLISPFFNGTIHALLHNAAGNGSIFWHRYLWLGNSPLAAVRNVVVDPRRLANWFAQRDVLAYLGTLVLSGGGLALFAPEALLVGLPVVLENSLSSFEWMRSGGAHYSTMLIPIFIFAGVEGTRRLGHVLGSSTRFARALAVLPLLVVLGAAAANHVWLGASPLVTPTQNWPTPDARNTQVEAILAAIPPNASISATSAIYPHLASRAQAYWFPAVQDADYVAIDVAASTDPVAPGEILANVSGLLLSGKYGVQASAPGFVLLRRGGDDDRIPDGLADFARAKPADLKDESRTPPIRFGDRLRLDGYRVRRVPTLTVFGPALELTTFWKVDQLLDSDLSFVFYPTRRADGAIVGTIRDQAAGAIWYPSSSWRPADTVALTVRIQRGDDLQAVGVAAIDPRDENPLLVSTGPGGVTWNNGTIARVVRLDGGS